MLPAGKTKFDETFQKTVETYRDVVRINVPVLQSSGSFHLLVTNQGCADRGLCYPPQLRGLDVRLLGFGGDGVLSDEFAQGRSTIYYPAPDQVPVRRYCYETLGLERRPLRW